MTDNPKDAERLAEARAAMIRAGQCLYIEVPELVGLDVNMKLQRLLEEYDATIARLTQEHDEARRSAETLQVIGDLLNCRIADSRRMANWSQVTIEFPYPKDALAFHEAITALSSLNEERETTESCDAR